MYCANTFASMSTLELLWFKCFARGYKLPKTAILIPASCPGGPIFRGRILQWRSISLQIYDKGGLRMIKYYLLSFQQDV